MRQGGQGGNFQKGRGRGGRSGGNQGNGNGGGGYRGGNSGGGNGGGGNRRGGGRGQGGRRYPQRNSFDSGNQRERIAIESGSLVFIDQFMLANPEFIEKFMEIIDEGSQPKNELIERFGGRVVDLPSGTYKIERDPFKFSIIIHREGNEIEKDTISEQATKNLGSVFIDTRCIAMIDRELLDDGGLLEKYQQLWFSGQDKACRDLLRDNGGAVRYGFSRNSDELGVYTIPDEDVVCLWPDITEEIPAAEAE